MRVYIQFFLNLLLAYLLLIYIWSKFGALPIKDVESKIWSFLFQWWKDNTQGISTMNNGFIPVGYAEQIHDSVKQFTNNNFDFTIWTNEYYSSFNVPCFSMDIVPTSNDIENDLPIMETQALDRFRKCTVADNILASRIVSEKIMGILYLHILYASNEDELNRYNALLETEKIYVDEVGLHNTNPISDITLKEALNLFGDTEGDLYVDH